MAELKLKARIREERGRSRIRRVRREGETPAIVYGKKKPPVSVALNNVEIQKKLKEGFHENALVKISIDQKGEKDLRTVLVKEIQWNFITGKILHIDFNEIALDEEIRANVATEPVGEPKGVKEQGGILEHVLHEVEIECLPGDIPEKIDVDVSALVIGDSIYVKDLPVSAKIKVLNDPEQTVFSVAAPRAEEEVKPAEPAEGEAAAEPELVAQKGKKEEAGEEGAEAEKAEEPKKEKKEK